MGIIFGYLKEEPVGFGYASLAQVEITDGVEDEDILRIDLDDLEIFVDGQADLALLDVALAFAKDLGLAVTGHSSLPWLGPPGKFVDGREKVRGK